MRDASIRARVLPAEDKYSGTKLPPPLDRARAARLVLYRERATRGLDLFTGEPAPDATRCVP